MTAIKRNGRGLLGSAVVGVAALIAACADMPVLAPAPEAVTTNGMAAKVSTEGFTIKAKAEDWPGLHSVKDTVTPMRVTLHNNSDRELRVRYSDFALVTESGRRFAALPPYGITGSVDGPRMPAGTVPIVRPGFHAYGFRIAAPYRIVYPTLSARADVSFMYVDPRYYAFYYPHWRRTEVQLPTAEMLRLVLPEGVLEPNGKLEGFLYFEYVGAEDPQTPVNFHADLIDANSGMTFAAVHIPFVANPVESADSAL